MPSRHLPAATPRGLRLVPSSTVASAVDSDPSACGARWARTYRVRLQVSDTLIVAVVVVATLALSVPWTSTGLFVAPPPAALAVPALVAAGWLVALAAYHTRDARVLGLGASRGPLRRPSVPPRGPLLAPR